MLELCETAATTVMVTRAHMVAMVVVVHTAATVVATAALVVATVADSMILVAGRGPWNYSTPLKHAPRMSGDSPDQQQGQAGTITTTATVGNPATASGVAQTSTGEGLAAGTVEVKCSTVKKGCT